MKSRIEVLVGSICFFCSGVFLWIVFIAPCVKTINWPIALALVVTNSVEEKNNNDNKKKYKYTFEAEYYVDGSSFFHKKTLREIGKTFFHNDHQKQVTTYPVGGYIDVFYNPLDPSDSFLEPGTRSKLVIIVFFIIYISLMLFFIYAIYVALFNWDRN